MLPFWCLCRVVQPRCEGVSKLQGKSPTVSFLHALGVSQASHDTVIQHCRPSRGVAMGRRTSYFPSCCRGQVSSRSHAIASCDTSTLPSSRSSLSCILLDIFICRCLLRMPHSSLCLRQLRLIDTTSYTRSYALPITLLILLGTHRACRRGSEPSSVRTMQHSFLRLVAAAAREDRLQG